MAVPGISIPAERAPKPRRGAPAAKREAGTATKLVDGPVGGKLKRSSKVREGAPPPIEGGKPDRKPDVSMSEALFLSICLEVASGTPLREICRRPDMPSKSGFYTFLEDEGADADTRAGRIARYARARKLGFDDIAEEALEIADDGRNDWIERTDPENPGWDYNGEHVQRSKLRVDTRLKLLAKWDPKRYGERLALSDPNGEPLGSAGKSASDLAIDIAKIMVAAEREGAQAETQH
jgi:hypothetical protein